jgi:hypothetical protein
LLPALDRAVLVDNRAKRHARLVQRPHRRNGRPAHKPLRARPQQRLRELRYSLSKLRLNDLHIGNDGRNRTLLGAFGSKTARNQPSNSKYIFGPAKWLRFLITPPPGLALIHRDFCQQEIRIAAVLSGDAALLEACETRQVSVDHGLPGTTAGENFATSRALIQDKRN